MKWHERYAERLDKELLEKLDRFYSEEPANESKTFPVIIQLHENTSIKKLKDLAELLPHEEETANIVSMNYIGAKLTPNKIEKLLLHPAVSRIHTDAVVKAKLDIATPAIGALAVRNQYGLTGAGVTVAVVDSGIAPHEDLVTPVNRIVGFRDFVSNRTTPYDDNGHGTYVAGCIAGNGALSGGVYTAPAPQARLVGVKVLDVNGQAPISRVIAGIDYVIQNRSAFNIRILNLSLGFPPSQSYTIDPLAQAAERAMQANIFVVCAAGNTGPGGRITSPGHHPRVVTVGAVDDRRTVTRADDVRLLLTSTGPTIDGLLKPDFFVPGNLVGPKAAGSVYARQYTNFPNYLYLSSTSGAAALVSGCAAQVFQAYPTYTSFQLKALMLQVIIEFGANYGYFTQTELFKLLNS
ncbi:S8 family peptidase [Fictibacillus iocasae]|uniref:S8 family peptidase n=1 Tax=Fictibacillus iocasae TaxID=2715437 RepID=A0ABW2NV99_9BACL